MSQTREAERAPAQPEAADPRREPQTDYIREAIKEDLRAGRFDRVHTRFPPGPNAYLHIGHAKAVWIDYGIALDFGGLFNLRFDDTNPLREEQEFVDGIVSCLDERKVFNFERWGHQGLPKVDPLWLLKYLPNLPASHIAIFNDLRGPSNSLTMREASSNLAVGEAYMTIVRGHADAMIAGATGTKVHPARTLHVVTQEEIATGNGDPAATSPGMPRAAPAQSLPRTRARPRPRAPRRRGADPDARVPRPDPRPPRPRPPRTRPPP